MGSLTLKDDYNLTDSAVQLADLNGQEQEMVEDAEKAVKQIEKNYPGSSLALSGDPAYLEAKQTFDDLKEQFAQSVLDSIKTKLDASFAAKREKEKSLKDEIAKDKALIDDLNKQLGVKEQDKEDAPKIANAESRGNMVEYSVDESDDILDSDPDNQIYAFGTDTFRNPHSNHETDGQKLKQEAAIQKSVNYAGFFRPNTYNPYRILISKPMMGPLKVSTTDGQPQITDDKAKQTSDTKTDQASQQKSEAEKQVAKDAEELQTLRKKLATLEATDKGYDPSKGLVWGKKFTPQSDYKAFKDKVVSVSADLGINPDWLMAVMYAESSLNPARPNPKSGAIGLIQFMPETAAGLGTSTDALRSMSAVQQMDYVSKFYQSSKNHLNSAGDLYAATFMPAVVGKPDDTIIGQSGNTNLIPGSSKITYDAVMRSNPGLDLTTKGTIYKSDLAKRAVNFMQQGAPFRDGMAEPTPKDPNSDKTKIQDRIKVLEKNPQVKAAAAELAKKEASTSTSYEIKDPGPNGQLTPEEYRSYLMFVQPYTDRNGFEQIAGFPWGRNVEVASSAENLRLDATALLFTDMMPQVTPGEKKKKNAVNKDGTKAPADTGTTQLDPKSVFANMAPAGSSLTGLTSKLLPTGSTAPTAASVAANPTAPATPWSMITQQAQQATAPLSSDAMKKLAFGG
jgi:hypothetical protein